MVHSTTDVEPRCPACGASGLVTTDRFDVATQHRLYIPFDENVQDVLTYEARAVPDYELMACTECGLSFARPMLGPKDAWYRVAYRALNVQETKRWEYGVVLERLTLHDTVYEMGCGAGTFLDQCRARHIAAFGTDFSSDAIAACTARGLQAAILDLDGDTSRGEPARVTTIAAFHVLEHLEAPHELFQHAGAMAAAGARLWLSVPSDSRTSRVLAYREPLDEPPHHLTRWTCAAFEAIGRRTGWRLVRVVREPFSWRSALWVVASNTTSYRWMQVRGWLRRPLVERLVRAVLYLSAGTRLLCHTGRRRMSGFSMIAEYERAV
jgi:SAM-dependent methyltransferase